MTPGPNKKRNENETKRAKQNESETKPERKRHEQQTKAKRSENETRRDEHETKQKDTKRKRSEAERKHKQHGNNNIKSTVPKTLVTKTQSANPISFLFTTTNTVTMRSDSHGTNVISFTTTETCLIRSRMCTRNNPLPLVRPGKPLNRLVPCCRRRWTLIPLMAAMPIVVRSLLKKRISRPSDANSRDSRRLC